MCKRQWLSLVVLAVWCLSAGLCCGARWSVADTRPSKTSASAPKRTNTRVQEGVFLQDGRRKKPLLPHEAEIKTDAKRKIAAFLILAIKEKKTVILPGPAAAMRVRTRKPTIHVNLPDAGESQFYLLRLQSKGNHREVTQVRIFAIRRETEKKEEIIFARIRGYSPREVRITPMEPLPPGEYGLVKLPRINPLNSRQVAVATRVWDFGVDGPPSRP